MPHYRIIVYGMVQNVNFRYNIAGFANDHGINGYVKNLPDKTVEIYFIGSEVLLEKFKNFIKRNPGYSKVSQIKIIELEKHQKFDSFQILY
ncbi:MAG: acylphosphatase [bacterium]|nr:acylphosphatase [bacterium]